MTFHSILVLKSPPLPLFGIVVFPLLPQPTRRNSFRLCTLLFDLFGIYCLRPPMRCRAEESKSGRTRKSICCPNKTITVRDSASLPEGFLSRSLLFLIREHRRRTSPLFFHTFVVTFDKYVANLVRLGSCLLNAKPPFWLHNCSLMHFHL